jgi:hypothetical protein
VGPLVMDTFAFVGDDFGPRQEALVAISDDILNLRM